MAVVQISRIQVRRGKKNAGTGLPQLASGEVAWAIDTQELYIGNGAVSEGSPYVGNTKILTEHDSLLDLAGQYEYKVHDSNVITGINPNYPIIRSLQDRLDETVSVYSFGVTGNGIDDDTATIQQAINQLYMTATARADTQHRVILMFPAGTYKLTSTLHIPSYVTLLGAGSEKTIFNYIGDSTVMEFVNDTSLPANFNPSTITYNNQPKNIRISGFTINSQTQNKTVLKLDSVRDSVFEDLLITGQWAQTPDTTSGAVGALQLNAFSTSVTCHSNKFINVIVKGFTHCVFAKGDITYNYFQECQFTDTYQAFMLGKGADLATSGQRFGPRGTLVTNCRFSNIKRQAVYLYNGAGNSVTDSTFINVGNNGGGNAVAVYPHVYFTVAGNTSQRNNHDRQTDLAKDNTTVAYVSEVSGKVATASFAPNQVFITQSSSPILAFRLPMSATITGYTIDYTIYSPTKSRSRAGTLTILLDAPHDGTQLTDEYNYFGSDSTDTTLQFSVVTRALGGVAKDTVEVQYSNPSDGDSGATMTYSYRVIQ